MTTLIPFSKSKIWASVQEDYCRLGIDAWVTAGVPFYMTCSPGIARTYCQLVAGFLRDCSAKRVTFLEVGGGTGRFAFHFLRQWDCLKKLFDCEFRYVLTDCAKANAQFWQGHPCLMPFYESKELQIGLYDPLKGGVVRDLEGARIRFDKEIVIVIGNYFFDTLPQDLFRRHEGRLQKAHLTAKAGDLSLEQLLETLVYLPEEKEEVGIDGYFLYPCGACAALENIKQLTDEPILWLAGDRGKFDLGRTLYEGVPQPARHGTFSYDVDFSALADFVTQQQGTAFLPRTAKTHFVVGGFAFHCPDSSLKETRWAWDELLERHEPEDQWQLSELLSKSGLKLSVEQFLACLRQSEFDIVDFNYLFNVLEAPAVCTSAQQKKRLILALEAVQKTYFPLSQKESLLFSKMGTLLLEVEETGYAKRCFTQAVALDAKNPIAQLGLKLCHESEPIPSDALHWMRKLLSTT